MSHTVLKHTTFFQFVAYLSKGKYYWEIKTYFLNTQLHIDFESKNVIITNITNLWQSTHCRLLKNDMLYEENYRYFLYWTKESRESNFCQSLRKCIPQKKHFTSEKLNVSQSLPQKPKLSTPWLFELLLLCKIRLQ